MTRPEIFDQQLSSSSLIVGLAFGFLAMARPPIWELYTLPDSLKAIYISAR